MVNEFPLGNVWGFFHKHQTRFPLCHIFLVWVNAGLTCPPIYYIFFTISNKPSALFFLIVKDHKSLPLSSMKFHLKITPKTFL
jgi:hypothetical protein